MLLVEERSEIEEAPFVPALESNGVDVRSGLNLWEREGREPEEGVRDVSGEDPLTLALLSVVAWDELLLWE